MWTIAQYTQSCVHLAHDAQTQSQSAKPHWPTKSAALWIIPKKTYKSSPWVFCPSMTHIHLIIMYWYWKIDIYNCLISITVSFYGDSFIKVPVEDASSKTDIKLNFRTAQKDGLLLLAAGSVDYCIVSLQAGAIVIHFELGSGESSLSTRPGLKFDDLRWHSIHLTRSQGSVRLNVDNSHISHVMMPGRFSELNIDRDVLAGGMGDDDQLHSSVIIGPTEDACAIFSSMGQASWASWRHARIHRMLATWRGTAAWSSRRSQTEQFHSWATVLSYFSTIRFQPIGPSDSVSRYERDL